MEAVKEAPVHHIPDRSWLETPDGLPRGYIQPQCLSELWFHTGTICNLRCPFCLEGSKPGDKRLDQVTLEDAKPFIGDAVDLGVGQFSFTGGEPFVNKHLIQILDYSLDHAPCMVLTNGTNPLRHRMSHIVTLRDRPNPLGFRISLDYPDPARHDEARGAGNFDLALDTMGMLHRYGFAVSVARLEQPNEDRQAVNEAYYPFFDRVGLPHDIHFTVFPDFLPPGMRPKVPHITENCMTTYHTEESRAGFMCNFSKMIVKKNGRMRVYACTLVDDDPEYDLGPSLKESMNYRIMLKHHRCFACFAHGASCSEM